MYSDCPPSVCACPAPRHMPTLLHISGCNLGEWEGLPSSCADLQLLPGFSLLWQHTCQMWNVSEDTSTHCVAGLCLNCNDRFCCMSSSNANQSMSMCDWQFMFHQPLRVINTMLLLTSALVLYQFYVLAQATEWSHILSVSILMFSNYTTLFKLTRDRIVLCRAYGKEESSMLWFSWFCWVIGHR